MQVRNRTTRSFLSQQHPGFTLVEMLVALGLVALLMALFAQVFQSATNTMSTQRGIMENDQRARVITTVLTNDLKYRTMTSVMPFQPGETDYPTASYYSFSERQGYFSISENDPKNTADDVLSFTTQLPVSVEPYYGRGQNISNIANDPNQPDADDSLVASNNTATSTMAEIVYFLRNGNLYRRVMLIRNPLLSTYDRQPRSGTTGLGSDLFTGYTGDFWRDYDFSARYDFVLNQLQFTGAGSSATNPLVNTELPGPASIEIPAIAIPLNRFGHDPEKINPNAGLDGVYKTADDSIGNPREYVGATFIGRYTQEETSHSNFNFPNAVSTYEIDSFPPTFSGVVGQLINDGNPMKFFPSINNAIPPTAIAITNPTSILNGDQNIVDQYEAGELDTRRGEDIILTNVHEFDVKVWDEVTGDYVDVGNLSGTGDFQIGKNQRISFGPDATANFSDPNLTSNRVFDTWHPSFNANNDIDVSNNDIVDEYDVAPYVPKSNYSTFTAWTASTAYNVGDIVIPTTANSATSTFYFKCTVAGTSDVGEPAWSRIDGATFIDGSVVWQAVLNLKRLKSMKITIRYYDVSSDQMRQVTLIKSLLD